MADFHSQTSRADPRGEAAKEAHPLSRATYAIGSIVSVGLVIGLGVWGYKLLVRDVSGVPVIRAAAGPMRVQPEDPGGRQAQNQGLSVNDVAAVGAASAAPDQLILAPAPLDLSDEDIAPENVTPPERVESASLVAETEAATDTAESDAADSAPSDDDAKMQALAEAINADVEPMPATSEDSATTEATQAEGAVAHSLRPKARPADLRNIRTVAATDAAVKDVDPATIAAGTRLAQLGAYASEDIARQEWAKIDARFDEYLAGKDRVIERATSGGRTFYRLRAMGFQDLAEARRFCSALVAEKAECIPVTVR